MLQGKNKEGRMRKRQRNFEMLSPPSLRTCPVTHTEAVSWTQPSVSSSPASNLKHSVSLPLLPTSCSVLATLQFASVPVITLKMGLC